MASQTVLGQGWLEAAQKELESNLTAVLQTEALDWKKHMVMVYFYEYPPISRGRPQARFMMLDIKGKTLHVKLESFFGEPNATGSMSWLVVAVVERAEVLSEIKIQK